MAPKEKLPDAAPMPTFFMPNFLGILFALGIERIEGETKLTSLLPETAHPYALMGLGAFVLFNTNSFLAGSVVNARVEFDVKLPNLYAIEGKHKHACLFNTIQRGHQNFLEQLPQLVLSLLLMNTVVSRPNVCGAILLVVSMGRIGYAKGYRSNNVHNRIPFILISMFAQAIGVGYAGIAGLSLFGINLLDF